MAKTLTGPFKIAPMQVYAIRKKGTHEYLPLRREGKRRSRSGFSHDEPILFGGEYGPRLFFKESSARRALTAWLQGCWTNQYAYHHDSFGREWDGVAPEEPPTPRKRENMEIIVLQLRELPRKAIGWSPLGAATIGGFLPHTRICGECHRNVDSPMFDGCMKSPCPHGFKVCL